MIKKCLFLFFFLCSIFWVRSPAYSQGYSFLIKVKISELKLYLIEYKGDILKIYPIAGPRFGKYRYPLVGFVKGVEINPYWYPTEKTRRDAWKQGKRLPKVVSPGPNNPLGIAMIKINWENWGEPVAIHGTNDPSSIGKRVTRGCIRLRNNDILELIRLIKRMGGGKIKVIIE